MCPKICLVGSISQTFVIPPSEDTIVTVYEVCEAINSSKSGKSPDHHGINSEHLKFDSNHTPIMLSFLFTSITLC